MLMLCKVARICTHTLVTELFGLASPCLLINFDSNETVQYVCQLYLLGLHCIAVYSFFSYHAHNITLRQ